MSMDYDVNQQQESSRSYIVTLLLALFLSGFGIHCFYTGYIVIGVIQLLTAGGFGLWALIDIISLALNKFVDVDGKELNNYNPGCGLIVLAIIIVSFIIGGISSVLSLVSIH